MSEPKREQLLNDLLATQAQITTLLTTVAEMQDWQPARDQWSFRQIASHLATAEKQCLQERIKQIAAGTNPRFSFYLDTETEFSEQDISDSLVQWAETRHEIIDFVNALPDERLAHTGEHITFGALTVLGYLQVFLDHDQRHLQDLQQMVEQYQQMQRNA